MNTQEDLSHRILDTIKKTDLQPQTRFRVQLRRIGLWIAVIACVGVASIAIGTTFSIAHGGNWEAYHQTGNLSKPVFLFLLSYFWLLLIGACVLGTYALFIRTRHGYRFRFVPIMSVVGVFGLCLGMFVFFSGTGYAIEDQCHRIIPGYGQVLSQSNQLWVKPDEGRLSGRVERIKAPQTFTVVDPYGHLWLVETGDELRTTVTQLEEEKTVRMTGSKIDNSTFFAKQIFMYHLPDSFFVIFNSAR
jgi:hypothetical protein